ncbi:MAG: SGNH/GDSL hydrolase family protein [Pirellulaceae bacterium]|jgi:lysophospholipase L1-like esterase|nr:SGNH/GDSL hydrolase family protein [Pirellulaceae bacterium]
MLLPRKLVLLGALIVSLAPSAMLSLGAAEPVLQPGDRVAIVGDSITEQKLYSKFVECYLLACSGVPDLKVMQYGWSGERAGGFADRLANDCAGFQPTVVTLCYGMNDGSYQPYNEQIGQTYEANMRRVLAGLEKLGVRAVVIGSPGAVDQNFFRPGQMMGNQPAHVAYNDNLAHLRDIDRKLAEEHKQPFANVHDAMYETMKKAQEKLGNKYDVCGGDGFHPGPNGQLIMAYAFLKGLGAGGNIGTITIDMQGKPSVAGGHKVLSGSEGTAEIESTQWPFCFDGDGNSSRSTRSITPFLPFNQDLNRLMLVVKNLDTPKAVVTWGDQSKEFTREELAAGVNLAAAFDQTPFDGPFRELVSAVGEKQNFETMMIKGIITQFRNYPPQLRDDAEVQAALATISKKLHAGQAALDAAAREKLVPVKHTIRVAQLP